jgi:hypothetical protein
MGKSSKSNVHPDHYKVRGRERPGDDVVPEIEKAKRVQGTESRRKRR